MSIVAGKAQVLSASLGVNSARLFARSLDHWNIIAIGCHFVSNRGGPPGRGQKLKFGEE